MVIHIVNNKIFDGIKLPDIAFPVGIEDLKVIVLDNLPVVSRV